MVHIKKLVIENFKSFGGKNEIKFLDKLNLIIGPNGSGKSNISEAISFVLGRMSKKGLRTEKLSHLVFNGGKSGKPADYAQVKLLFSNEDRIFPLEEDLIEVARRINKDGQSEYRINGKKATRVEVINLLDYVGLSPDGFNMIMQGNIAKFVDMSSVERGQIIEGISGISTYEDKKEKALKELEKVNEKIKETNILLKERLKHLEELKKEKKQAEKFQNTKEQLQLFKGRLVFKRLTDKKEEQKSVEEKMEKLREKIRTNTQNITDYDKRIKLLQEEIKSLNQVLGASGAEKKKELDNKIISIKEENNALEANIKSHNNEIKRIKDRDAQITKNLFDYDKEVEKLESDIKKYDEEIKKLNNELKELRDNSSSQKEVNYFDLKARVNEIKEALLDLRNQEDSLIKKQESFKNYKDYQEDLVNKNSLMNNILSKLEQEMSINSDLALRLENAANKLDTLKMKVERLETQKSMVFQKAGSGLKELMQQNLQGIEGTVSQLCKVNEKYELPIRVAAGRRLLNVVVNNEDTAKKAINFLRENKLGVITFLPLNKIRAVSQQTGYRTINGVIDYLINLIDFNNRYKNIFEYIFQDTLLVENLDVAKKVGVGNVRMVTLQGDLIEKSGAITGGFRREDSSSVKISGKSNDDELNEVQAEISKIKTIYEKLKATKAENDNNIISLREKRASLTTEIKNLNMLIEDLNNKSKGFDVKLLEKIKKEVEALSDELVGKEVNLQKYEKTFNMEDFEKTKIAINDLEAKLNSVNINKGIKSSRIKQLVERELVDLKKIKEDLNKQAQEFEKEIKDYEKKLEINNNQLKVYEKEEKSFEDKLQANYKKKDKLEEELNGLKLKVEEKKIHINDDESKINDMKLLIAEIVSKIEGLELKFEEYKNLDIKEVRKPVKELEHEIFLLEKKLETFGNVNLKALDVFKVVEEEFNEVKEKMDKLEEENNSILNTMREIETKKTATFMETFKEIQDNFERIFGILSPGGIANLIIEDPENPIEGGIDIKARPKGKKFLTLKSMSGGEKTLTALSFIFALQEYDPAPFYILDEVDAALDKENATRFGKLCKQYSEKAQFLTISHNDNVISEADYLYGISMNPDGVSKVITLKLPE
ncbi:MAG: chromosome segregation protein SMC [Nanoarchaeota archaeon]|nr:chromosome segregation protein SMC [Nanoarchaeota archaeon]